MLYLSSALLTGPEMRTRSCSCPSCSVLLGGWALVMALTCYRAATWCLAASPQVFSHRTSIRVSCVPAQTVHTKGRLVEHSEIPASSHVPALCTEL